MKNKFIIALIFFAVVFSAYRKPEEYVIDSTQNAYLHNNMGLVYLRENSYYPAIQEFKIAISLAPDVQASAVFYNNLGECYMKLSKPDLAQDCFEKAIQQYSLNFKYYQNIAQCYYQLGLADSQIQKSYKDKNPLGMILRGLLMEQKGDITNAITTLDEFAAKEPDILITAAVKQHLKTLVKKANTF